MGDAPLKVLLCLLLLPALAFGAIDGTDDTLYLAGVMSGTLDNNRTSTAGWCRNDAITTSDGRLAQRGRHSNSALASYGGPHVSTQAINNDWTTTDFVGDVYWWHDVFDTLLDCCMGVASIDTQYISSVTLEFTLFNKTAQIDSLRGKIQGPVLIRPKPPNSVSGTGRTFGTSGVDSSPCFNWLNRNNPSANDTTFWRDSTVAGAPGFYDSTGIIGDDYTDYSTTLTSGGNFTTRFDVGAFGEGGPTGNPILWSPVGVAGGSRVTGVDITPIFKTAMVASSSGASGAGAAAMRALGFGVLINWVYFQATSSERFGKALTDQWARITVHNGTTGTSMGLRIVFKTDLDNFCANKMKDAGNFRFPWYRRANALQGSERDRIQGQGERRQRPTPP